MSAERRMGPVARVGEGARVGASPRANGHALGFMIALGAAAGALAGLAVSDITDLALVIAAAALLALALAGLRFIRWGGHP